MQLNKKRVLKIQAVLVIDKGTDLINQIFPLC